MLNISPRSAIAAAAVFVCGQFMSAAPVAAASSHKWGGWAELGGFAGSDNAARGEAAVFVPLVQTDKGLFFTDARGKLFEDDIDEVNAALGYRHMLDSGWNAGLWLGGDRRTSSTGNVFWGLSGGLEMLSDRFDARLNGYLAMTDAKRSASTTQARIEGNQVFIEGAEEIPLSGADGEVGVRVPLALLDIDPATHALRVYAGAFYFDDEDAAESVGGPKARLEYRIDDVIAGLPGSRLTLEGAWRSDGVRGGNVEGGFRFRLPFATFAGGADAAGARPVQWRRMTDGLVRDTDIVTVASGQEPVEDALTGVDFDQVAEADATTGVTAPAAAAGGNTLITVDGAAGVITGPQVLQANQTLLGGGGSILVRGQRSGATAMLTGPGSRPTFSNTAASAIITAADRTHIAGANLSGNAAGSVLNDGVLLGSSQFVVLQDVDIADFSGAGIFGNNSNTIQLMDVSMTNGVNGPVLDLNDFNTVTISGSRFSNTVIGILLDDDNAVTVDMTSLSNTVGDAFNMDNRNTLTISNSTISNVGDDVVFGFDGNVITISDTTITTSANDLVDVVDTNTVTLTNVTATGIGGKGVWVDDDNSVTVSGGSLSTTLETIDVDDRNTVVLSDAVLASTGGQETVDISDNNTLTMTGVTASAAGNRVLEISASNNVTVNLSSLGGTPTDTIGLDGTGNTLSGSGNVDNSVPTGVFCSNAGAQTGSISFTNGTTCP